MVNSSDWLGALAEPLIAAPGAAPTSAPPEWLALLDVGAEFRPAAFFASPEPKPEPEPEPHVPTVPDPAAGARARAFAEGEAAGRTAGAAEAEAGTARQRALRLSFRALDEAARGVLADDLAATVIALCESALAGCALDRDALMARCVAAARRIGGATDALALQLHPDDIALLGEDALAGWRVLADAALERGSVRIEGPDGSVSDGPAEWRRAIAAAVRG